MDRIGYIDDDEGTFKDLEKYLKCDKFEILFVKEKMTERQIVDWVVQNNIKCMLVDYKLNELYDFNGTSLVFEINRELPDLPCIILSSHCPEGIAESIVIKSLFIERNDFTKSKTSREYANIIELFTQAIEVFKKRIALQLDRYRKLLAKRKSGQMSNQEEESFLSLYRTLRTYGELDDIPDILLSRSADTKLDELLRLANLLLEENE